MFNNERLRQIKRISGKDIAKKEIAKFANKNNLNSQEDAIKTKFNLKQNLMKTLEQRLNNVSGFKDITFTDIKL